MRKQNLSANLTLTNAWAFLEKDSRRILSRYDDLLNGIVRIIPAQNDERE